MDMEYGILNLAVKHKRYNQLEAFVKASLHTDTITLQALGGDASFRHYYRALGKIIVDSPPDTQKNHEFADINARLKNCGVRVPEIYAMDLKNGFFILEDLGDTLFYDKAVSDEKAVYYKKAIDMLLKIGTADSKGLPPFDRDFILFELNICTQWCLEKALGLELDDKALHILDKGFAALADNCLAQRQIAMHRDFHCRNIMLHEGQLCCIDFQDMVCGPLLYDLASLIFDCYIKLDDALVDELMHYAYDRYTSDMALDMSYSVFAKTLYMTSLQRHIKVLGIFNRLYLRDGKSSYLKDLPLVLEYVLHECDRCDLKELGAFFKDNLEGKFR